MNEKNETLQYITYDGISLLLVSVADSVICDKASIDIENAKKMYVEGISISPAVRNLFRVAFPELRKQREAKGVKS